LGFRLSSEAGGKFPPAITAKETEDSLQHVWKGILGFRFPRAEETVKAEIMNSNESIPLYRDGRHYDAINRDIVADIPFYVEEAQRADGPVLELACGTGRLTIPIAQRGISIEGVDRSPSMLAHLRTKAEQAGMSILVTEADMRDFDLGRKFSLIFMGFNSMQHLHDYTSQAALFANVRKHLSPGGRFVFDVFNPKIAFLAQSGEARKLEREYEDPDGQGKIAMEQTLVYDDAVQVSHIRWYFSRTGPNGGEKDFRAEDLHLRCFYPQELDLLVRSQGFEMLEKFGNFERQPFGSGDMKQIVICR
jgi:SAM-dependent methyltransferase